MMLQYHGEIVTLKKLVCFSYSEEIGYVVHAEYDGIPFAPFKDFWELDAMLAQADHGKPKYQKAAIIELPDVQAVLEDKDNSYRVHAVYCLDGKSTVSREQVIEAQAAKHKQHADDNEKYRGMTSFQIMAAKTQEAKEAKQAEIEAEQAERSIQIIDHAIFAPGEKLIRERLAQLRQEQAPAPTLDIFKLRNAHWMKGRVAWLVTGKLT